MSLNSFLQFVNSFFIISCVELLSFFGSFVKVFIKEEEMSISFKEVIKLFFFFESFI